MEVGQRLRQSERSLDPDRDRVIEISRNSHGVILAKSLISIAMDLGNGVLEVVEEEAEEDGIEMIDMEEDSQEPDQDLKTEEIINYENRIRFFPIQFLLFWFLAFPVLAFPVFLGMLCE